MNRKRARSARPFKFSVQHRLLRCGDLTTAHAALRASIAYALSDKNSSIAAAGTTEKVDSSAIVDVYIQFECDLLSRSQQVTAGWR